MSETSQRNFFKRPVFIWLTVLIVVLLLAGVALIVINLSSSSIRAQMPSGAPAPSPSSHTEQATVPDPSESTISADGHCPESTSRSVDADPNPDLKIEWRRMGAVIYPVSKSLGPFKESNGIASCFARSSDGAALAAASFLAAANTPGLMIDVLQQRSLGSLKSQNIIDAEESGNTPLSATGRSTIAAYRVFNFTPDRAVVEMGTTFERGSRTQYVSTHMVLVWQDDDWYLWTDVPSDMAASAVPSLQGMTFWKD